MKKTVLITLIVFALFLLTACSPAIKETDEILNDLANHPGFFNEYDVTLNNIEIMKRQTNKDDKTDFIWVTAYADSDLLSCELGYYLEYTLYNEGWVLDRISRDQTGIWSIITVKPSNEQMMADLKGDDFIISQGLSLKNLSAAQLIEGNQSSPASVIDEPAPPPPADPPSSGSEQTTVTYPAPDPLPALKSRNDSGDPFIYQNTVRIEADNENALFTIDYDVSYRLGKDGWKIQSSNVREFRAIPVSTISQDALDSFLLEFSNKSGYDSILPTDRNTDLGKFADELTYTATKVYKNAYLEYDVYVVVLFDQKQGEWIIQPNIEESEAGLVWTLENLIGKWGGTWDTTIGNQHRSFTIDIASIDEASIQTNGNYSHTLNVFTFAGTSTIIFADMDFDDNYQLKYDNTEREFSFWLGSYEYQPWMDKFNSDMGVIISIDDIFLQDSYTVGRSSSVSSARYDLSRTY